MFAAVVFLLALTDPASFAAISKPQGDLPQKLTQIRTQILSLEQGLIDGVKDERTAAYRLRSIHSMLSLQKQEKILGEKRMIQLENVISELENRRNLLYKRISAQKEAIRSGLTDLKRSEKDRPLVIPVPESEASESPRRRVITKIVDHRIQEIEALKIDLSDADQLEGRIQEEKQQLAYLFQDLKEQEGLLEFNRGLQEDILRKKHLERINQLRNYKKLKDSESEVERLITQFSARMEIKRAQEAQREVSKSMVQGQFYRLKGKLRPPVPGRVTSGFGRGFDAKSNLYVFRKGIEISFDHKQAVKSVAGGRVVYSGTLPGYGKVAIVDHGAHYYSLCAHLGELKRKAGELVAEGDELGWSDEPGNPVYFEIRARNVAVNPLQWLAK